MFVVTSHVWRCRARAARVLADTSRSPKRRRSGRQVGADETLTSLPGVLATHGAHTMDYSATSEPTSTTPLRAHPSNI
ncbi:hypothetical protein O3G_MSEX003570 [Manduca sexta]|uniref:Uncharacterized protein n=1 Tax=Manduca sexta TaxID=7130 RepID=A0A922CFX7_MANSE|nr:hypothetical protein O3G_MSEX003570 [Manduca sexta]